MTSRSLSVFALGLSLSVAPAMLATAQTMAPADTSSSNAAPAAPGHRPATPAPAAPAPADTTTTPATPEERPTTYTMVAGDTLDSIAHKFDTSIHALAKLNKIPKSMFKKLRTGTVLKIPAKPEAASTSTNK